VLISALDEGNSSYWKQNCSPEIFPEQDYLVSLFPFVLLHPFQQHSEKINVCVKSLHIYELMEDFCMAMFTYSHLTHKVLSLPNADSLNTPFLRNLIPAMGEGLL
jgi:hypothetical protein